MEKQGFVYILTNKKEGALYIGVTSDLVKRIFQHKMGEIKGFSKKYQLKQLVFFEAFDDIQTAILYEKKLKHMRRIKKLEIIQRENPAWNDLAATLLDSVQPR